MENLRKIIRSSLMLTTFFTSLEACSKKPVVNAPPEKVFYPWQQMVMGCDLSYVNAVEASGGIYRENGVAAEPFVLLQKHGTNTVRVRLWHASTWQQGLGNAGTYGDLADATKTIRRAKAAGMAVNLDLHYSDTWADPDHQQIPAAWQGLPLNLLADSVYAYTRSVLQHLAAQNLVPEMIQVGNETNGGMLWPVGKTDGGWANFAVLLKAGIRAVRDFSLTSAIKPKIILHQAQLQTAEAWVAELINAGVTDYDILGLSHYYKWSTVNDWAAMTQTISRLKNQSGKDVMVVETAFPFTNLNADSYNNIFYEPSGTAVGYLFSPEGQLKYYTDLTRAILKGGGKGIMVWEPAWITSRLKDGWGTGSSWENNAFFDFSGNLHEGIGFMTRTY